MIETNLLPQELRLKDKKFGVDLNYFLYLIPLVFGVLVCLHIYLATLGIVKHYHFRALNNSWQKLGPQRKILEEYKRENDAVSADAVLIQKLISQRITWSKKLNKLSLKVPSGIWFNELAFTPTDFILKGSAISLQKEELNLINKFMDSLKSDTDYFKDFNNLELSSVQRRTIASYDIVDFILVSTVKSK